MMATRGTERMRAAQVVPKFGLRFDRGRTELVLDAALTLENGVRLDAMRTELVPLAGRLSLTEGWRAFRHRRSTLVSATLSIGLRELGSMIERAIGLPLRLLALAPNVVSCATTTPALCIATELEWGWDGVTSCSC